MMPASSPYFLNPSAGFTPSQPAPLRPTMPTGQMGSGPQMAQPPVFRTPTNFTIGQPQRQQNQGTATNAAAVRPTDQSDNPQAAWLQNMASFAGGNLAGSTAFGNQPQQGPVRRLVDVLGQQPFGEQNPMTLLMQALQQGNYGVQMPTPTPPVYRPPFNTNPAWGGPSRPMGFNPMQMFPQ